MNMISQLVPTSNIFDKFINNPNTQRMKTYKLVITNNNNQILNTEH